MSLIKIIDKNYKKKQLDMKKLLKSKKLNIKFFENNILQIYREPEILAFCNIQTTVRRVIDNKLKGTPVSKNGINILT